MRTRTQHTTRHNPNSHETPLLAVREPAPTGSREQALRRRLAREDERARRKAERRAERPAARAMAALRAAELVGAA